MMVRAENRNAAIIVKNTTKNNKNKNPAINKSKKMILKKIK